MKSILVLPNKNQMNLVFTDVQTTTFLVQYYRKETTAIYKYKEDGNLQKRKRRAFTTVWTNTNQ